MCNLSTALRPNNVLTDSTTQSTTTKHKGQVLSGALADFSGSSATNVIDTKVATKDPPSLAQPRAFSTHSSPEGWYERSGASPCSVLTASMAQVTGDPPYTTLAASHTRGFGREHT